MFNGSLRSLRCSLESRRLRRIRRNDLGAQPAPPRTPSRRLLLQIGGANVAGADRALEAAYFVVARGREACPLVPPQHVGARHPIWLLPLAKLGVSNGSLRSLRCSLESRRLVGFSCRSAARTSRARIARWRPPWRRARSDVIAPLRLLW